MMKKLLPLLLFIALTSSKCKNIEKQSGTETQKAQEKPENVAITDTVLNATNETGDNPVQEKPTIQNNNKIDTSQAANKLNKNFYRIVIEFFSIGEGTDTKAIQALDALIANSKIEYGTNVAFVKYPWGREGEFDYCLPLNELNNQAADLMVDAIKKTLASSKLVHILENAPSRHKR